MSRRNWDRVRTEDRARHTPLQSEKQYLRAHKPLTRKQAKFIRSLREEVGEESGALPKTCREGGAEIDRLLNLKRMLERRHAGLDRQMDARLERAA